MRASVDLTAGMELGPRPTPAPEPACPRATWHVGRGHERRQRHAYRDAPEIRRLLSHCSVDERAAPGEEAQSYWNIEPGPRIIDGSELPPMARGAMDDAAFVDTDAGARSPRAAQRALHARLRSDITIKDDQLESLVRSHWLVRDTLVADDVKQPL